MSESNSELAEPRVKIVGPTKELAEQVIDGTITKEDWGRRFCVTIGNTGLQATFAPGESAYTIYLDFLSANYYKKQSMKSDISIESFAYGINHLVDWCRESGQIDLDKVGKATALTDTKFSRFLQKLFKHGGHSELIKVLDMGGMEGATDTLEIDLKGLMQLEGTDPLITKFRKMGKRAEGRTIKTMLPVE